jgi:hypothetical protein
MNDGAPAIRHQNPVGVNPGFLHLIFLKLAKGIIPNFPTYRALILARKP